MRILVFVFFMLMTQSASASEGTGCHLLVPNFSPKKSSSTAENKFITTENFIAYMEQLLELQVITLESLKKFQVGIEQNQILNPLAKPTGNQFSINLIHSTQIEDFINSENLDLSQLLAWVNEKIKLEETEKKNRDEKKKETVNIWTKMSFVTVPGGDFEIQYIPDNSWKETGDPQNISIEMPTFETMSTHVTQMMWLEVMGDIPNSPHQRYVDGTMEIHHKGKIFTIAPEAPVTHVSWWSMLKFANEISKLHGLEPAYDLDDIEFDPNTSASNGTLNVALDRKDDPGKLVKINSKSGIYHEATGFRLPSLVEKKYLMSYFDLFESPDSVDAILGKLHLIKDPLGWGRFNAVETSITDHQVHGVGTYPVSLKIQGKPIHDFMGNIVEMLFDGRVSGGFRALSERLIVEPNTNYRINFGVRDNPSILDPNYTIYTRSSPLGFANIGFRLSRTLSPEEVKP